MLARDGIAAEVTDSMSALRAHILKEQDGVFPAALSVLNAADWLAVEDARALDEARSASSLKATDDSVVLLTVTKLS